MPVVMINGSNHLTPRDHNGYGLDDYWSSDNRGIHGAVDADWFPTRGMSGSDASEAKGCKANGEGKDDAFHCCFPFG
jgi:hypothetical protein